MGNIRGPVRSDIKMQKAAMLGVGEAEAYTSLLSRSQAQAVRRGHFSDTGKATLVDLGKKKIMNQVPKSLMNGDQGL